MIFSLPCLSHKRRHLPRTNRHINFVTNMRINFVSFTHTHPIQELLLQVLLQKSSINLWQKSEIPLRVSLNMKFYELKIQNFERQSAFPECFVDLHGLPERDHFSFSFFLQNSKTKFDRLHILSPLIPLTFNSNRYNMGNTLFFIV